MSATALDADTCAAKGLTHFGERAWPVVELDRDILHLLGIGRDSYHCKMMNRRAAR